MTNPLISIIIPCYRQGQYLTETLQSALNQSYPHIEIVVVNNGSDDNTDEVARSFEDKIRYVAIQENIGMSAGRNLGISQATGDCLLFLDSDDLLHPEAVSWLVEARQGYDDGLVVMGYRFFENSPDEKDRPQCIPGKNDEAFPMLIHHCWGPPNAFLSPRSMVTKIGGLDESNRTCADWDLWVRLCFAGARWIRVNRVGAYYRRYAEQMSRNGPLMLQGGVQVLMTTHREMKNRPAMLEKWGQELLQAEYRMLRRCIARHMAGDEITTLYSAIRELQELGVQTRGRIRILADSLLGHNSERIALLAFRLFKPNDYADYCNSHY